MLDIFYRSWPLLLVIFVFFYLYLRSRRVRKLLPELLARGGIIIDVRSEAEFQSGHLKNSTNIPLPKINEYIGDINKNIPIILCCASGVRSGAACALFRKNGFKEVYNLGAFKNGIQKS